jgi:hypothetical protein
VTISRASSPFFQQLFISSKSDLNLRISWSSFLDTIGTLSVSRVVGMVYIAVVCVYFDTTDDGGQPFVSIGFHDTMHPDYTRRYVRSSSSTTSVPLKTHLPALLTYNGIFSLSPSSSSIRTHRPSVFVVSIVANTTSLFCATDVRDESQRALFVHRFQHTIRSLVMLQALYIVHVCDFTKQ